MFKKNDIVVINRPESNKRFMGVVTGGDTGYVNTYVFARVMAPMEDIGSLIIANIKNVTLAKDRA